MQRADYFGQNDVTMFFNMFSLVEKNINYLMLQQFVNLGPELQCLFKVKEDLC